MLKDKRGKKSFESRSGTEAAAAAKVAELLPSEHSGVTQYLDRVSLNSLQKDIWTLKHRWQISPFSGISRHRCVSNQIFKYSIPNSGTIWFHGETCNTEKKKSIWYFTITNTDLMCVKSLCAITQPCTYLTNWFQIIKLCSAKYQMFSIQIWCILFEMVIWQCFYWIWYWDFQIVHDLIHISDHPVMLMGVHTMVFQARRRQLEIG